MKSLKIDLSIESIRNFYVSVNFLFKELGLLTMLMVLFNDSMKVNILSQEHFINEKTNECRGCDGSWDLVNSVLF